MSESKTNDRQEPGVCPLCHSLDIEYMGGEVEDGYGVNFFVYSFVCQDCGAVGEEVYSMEFVEMTAQPDDMYIMLTDEETDNA